MPKKKLFNGSKYLRILVSDRVHSALWTKSIYLNKPIADIVRALLDAWTDSPHSAIPEDKIEMIASRIDKIIKQRNSKKSK